MNLNRGANAGPSIINTQEGVYAIDELIYELKKITSEYKNSVSSRNSEFALQPLFWENRIDELIYEEEIF